MGPDKLKSAQLCLLHNSNTDQRVVMLLLLSKRCVMMREREEVKMVQALVWPVPPHTRYHSLSPLQPVHTNRYFSTGT